LNAGIKGDFADLKGVIRTNYTINEAKGKYLDYSSMNFSIKGSQAFGDWEPSIKHYFKEKTMVTEDPNQNNLTPYYSIHAVVLKLQYTLSSKLIFSLESGKKTQSSNIDNYNYERNTMTFSISTIF
ncbi:MAG: hypothetical protein HQ517_17160, partial [SAR324 cluster bacterium]|nr:hypothetical protein [SAR324 cluster bacterium]